MGARSIYFTDEMENMLKDFKKADEDFSLSDLVKSAMLTNDRLTVEQITVKMGKLQADRDEIDLQLAHLERVIPLAEKDKEDELLENSSKVLNALEVIIRNSNNPDFRDMLAIHAKMTGISGSKLIKMAEEKKTEDFIKAEDKKMREKIAMEEIYGELEEDDDWREQERLSLARKEKEAASNAEIERKELEKLNTDEAAYFN